MYAILSMIKTILVFQNGSKQCHNWLLYPNVKKLSVNVLLTTVYDIKSPIMSTTIKAANFCHYIAKLLENQNHKNSITNQKIDEH